jgi:hypothetical protein
MLLGITTVFSAGSLLLEAYLMFLFVFAAAVDIVLAEL